VGAAATPTYLRSVVPAGMGNKPLLKNDMILPYFTVSVVGKGSWVRYAPGKVGDYAWGLSQEL